MTRFPFTPQGFAKAQEVLYQLSDLDLLREAYSAAGDFLSWTACRFELEVYLLEELRNLPEAFRLQLGWCVAASLLGRRPLLLKHNLMLAGGDLQIENLSFRMEFAAASLGPQLKGPEGHLVITLGNSL